MRSLLYALLIIFSLTLPACKEKQTILDPDKPVYVKISTNMGNVTVLLYDDTPLHRDNFIRLCQSNAHNGVIFHRVIKDFVVQGGDPNSKERKPGVRYGDGNGGYTVPAEILPHHFNKRGALIDAKKSDEVNPQRASAGTQFCFIQGKIFTDEELDEIEKRINAIRYNWLYYTFVDYLIKENPRLKEDYNKDQLNQEASIMLADTMSTLLPLYISPERREIYKTIGGAPHLDGSVTVFGEVVEGLDIVEKMSLVETDANDRPKEDIVVKSTKVYQK